MKFKEKQKAIEYRKQGMSIGDIASILNVSKASVSLWVRDVILGVDLKNKLVQRNKSSEVIEKRRLSRLKNESLKRDKVTALAERDFDSLKAYDLKIAGCMLYFAEGGKTQRGLVRFSNSNPVMIKIMMRFFREICLVRNDKFKGHIHTHSSNQAEKAEIYWSGVTGIPKKNFFKTYIKPSSSSKQYKNNLTYGTFDIYICDTVLFLKIKGWMNRISALLLSFNN